MKKIKYIVLLITILLLTISCREETELNNNVVDPTLGGVYTEIGDTLSGTLSYSDSPFLVRTDIVVNADDTLIIEPGIYFFFDDDRKMTVNGVLIAEGTKQKPIIFKSFQTGWFGISIKNSPDTSRFKFCIIQDVYQRAGELVQNGAIEIFNSSAIFENCIFKSNSVRYGGGLAILNSNVRAMNNIFRNNDAETYGGALFAENSTTELINNTIYRNSCFNYGGGFVFSNPVTADIQNNIFYKNFSFAGDTRIALISGDSTAISEQYNFLAFGTMNPLFFSTTNLHLTSGSPCIDAGNPSPEYNDVNGTRNDQGAYGGPLGDW